MTRATSDMADRIVTGARRPRLVLFSGLGIPPALLTPQFHINGVDVTAAAWPTIVAAENIAQFAARAAEQIVASDDLYVGGVSFGGMVALEVARIVRPRGVFLIAAAKSGSALSPIVRLVALAASKLPMAAVELGLKWSPLLVRMVGRPDRVQREYLLDLAEASIASLTHWGGRVMLDWTAPPLPCPVWQVHGSDDRMIPVKNVSPDLVIPGGGHVINVTHAAAVNQFIRERIVG